MGYCGRMPQKAQKMSEKTANNRVPVYDSDNRLVAHVKYNQNLDFWDGNNYTSGSAGRHLGIAVLKGDRYVLIHGTQWQGERNLAEIVSAEDALDAIVRTNSCEILNSPRFAALKKLYDEKIRNQEVD